MIKVYKALSFQGIINGGKTSPWLVLVNAEGTVKPFVVKLFDREKHFEGDALSREVIGNVLAKQFGLDVPQCALIDMEDPAFASSILNNKALERFRSLKIKIAFGTAYLYPHFCFFYDIFRSTAPTEHFKIDSVFAFDIMIRNTDRNYQRPNLLVHGGLTYLIDFESSFQLRKDSLGDILARIKTHTFYYMHVFHSLLCNWEADKKEKLFEDFFTRLASADFSILDAYMAQLQDIGFVIQQYQQITAHLEAVKQDRLLFYNALRSLIHG